MPVALSARYSRAVTTREPASSKGQSCVRSMTKTIFTVGGFAARLQGGIEADRAAVDASAESEAVDSARQPRTRHSGEESACAAKRRRRQGTRLATRPSWRAALRCAWALA